MKKVAIILFLGSVFYTNCIKGQDMHFTQFYSSPLYLNPAFAGANVCARAALTYRNQWPGVDKTYSSYLFGMDHSIQKYNMGVGLLLGSDIAGTGRLRTTIINPIVAYGLRITKGLAFRAAFQPGITIKNIDYNRLFFGDQIVNGGKSSTATGGTVASVEQQTQSHTFFDMSTGMLLYTTKFWIGTSFFHITNSNESLFKSGESFLPLKYTVHGGARFLLNDGGADESKNNYISPAFHYRGQQDFDQLDLGFYYIHGIFNVGLWYRGIPILKSYDKKNPARYLNQDAFAIIVGVQTGRFNVGYSFDFTISNLKMATHGAHEITLSYQLCESKRRKPKYGLMLPCPKF